MSKGVMWLSLDPLLEFWDTNGYLGNGWSYKLPIWQAEF